MLFNQAPTKQGSPPQPKSAFLPLTTIILCAFIIVPVLTYFAEPRSRPVAVIFPFGFSANQSLALLSQYNLRLINNGFSDNIWIVDPQNTSFIDKIKGDGALAVLNPAFVGICNS